MFEEYSCGCILSRFQGRVRVCVAHRNVIEYHGAKWTVRKSDPTGRVVRAYPANGVVPKKKWIGR